MIKPPLYVLAWLACLCASVQAQQPKLFAIVQHHANVVDSIWQDAQGRVRLQTRWLLLANQRPRFIQSQSYVYRGSGPKSLHYMIRNCRDTIRVEYGAGYVRFSSPDSLMQGRMEVSTVLHIGFVPTLTLRQSVAPNGPTATTDSILWQWSRSGLATITNFRHLNGFGQPATALSTVSVLAADSKPNFERLLYNGDLERFMYNGPNNPTRKQLSDPPKRLGYLYEYDVMGRVTSATEYTEGEANSQLLLYRITYLR